MEILVNGAQRTLPDDLADPAHALFALTGTRLRELPLKL